MNQHTTAPTTTDRPLTTRPAAHRALATVVALGLGLAAVTGCSAQQGDEASSSAQSSTSASASAAPLTLDNGWAKAADSGMTAAFGTLTNTSDKDVTLTGATALGTAESVQLHETVTDGSNGSSTMKEKDGGFTIPAGKSITLEPGGNHIMLMGLTCSLKAGADLTLQLRTDAGTQDVTVPVRDYSGAKEEYAPGEGASGSADPHASHSGMDMSSSAATGAPSDEHAGHDHSGHGDASAAASGSSEHAGHEGMAMSSPSSSALPECHAH